MPLVIDPERPHAPTPHNSTGAKTRNWSFEVTICQAFNAARDLCVEVRRGGWIAFVEIGDRVDDVGDRLFGVRDLQRPRAASMISRARFSSITRPCRYDRGGLDATFFFRRQRWRYLVDGFNDVAACRQLAELGRDILAFQVTTLA